MSPAETVEVLIAAWKLIVARFPGATIAEAQSVATTFAHLPLPFLNRIFIVFFSFTTFSRLIFGEPFIDKSPRPLAWWRVVGRL